MKEYRNFVLINSDNFIVTATYANCSSEVSYKQYKRQYPVNKINNNIDTLKVLNKHMAYILKCKEEGTSLSVYYLLIPPKLCKVIKDKLYKTWIETGKNSAGFPIKKEELDQWQIFNTLYRSIFADIAFKPNNIYNSKDINKAYKHVVFTKNAIDKMYVYLDKLEEKNKISTIDDLLRKNI